VRLLRWLNKCARLLEVRDPARSAKLRGGIAGSPRPEEPFSMTYERPDLNDDVFGASEKAFRRGYHQGAQEAVTLILTEGVAKSAVLRWMEYVSLESRVPAEHPLRGIKALLDEALASMSRDFERVCAREGRPSIPPKRLVRAAALQILYSIRSERLLCEQLDYNLLFRWFVGLSIDEPIWDHSSFTQNRDRLIEAKVARKLLRRMVRRAKKAQLLSNQHFSVDGTLIESWAAVKSYAIRRIGVEAASRGFKVDGPTLI
jgi:transposase